VCRHVQRKDRGNSLKPIHSPENWGTANEINMGEVDVGMKVYMGAHGCLSVVIGGVLCRISAILTCIQIWFA
jgi:hypothetical protein